MNDDDLIRFVDAMCNSGEASHYGWQKRDDAAASLAEDVKEQTLAHFNESVGMLRRVKTALKEYSNTILLGQLNEALGSPVVSSIYTRYVRSYEWTVGLMRADESDEWLVQLKFGPSAWFANNKDAHWKVTVSPLEADYSRLFLTYGDRIHQSAVTLHEVLDGLGPEDTRLRDELAVLVSPGAP